MARSSPQPGQRKRKWPSLHLAGGPCPPSASIRTCSEERGYAGQLLRYYSMRRFVPKLEARLALAVRRMECEPDFEAQVDDGTGAPVLGPDGRRRPGIHLEKLGNLCGRRKVCRKAP